MPHDRFLKKAVAAMEKIAPLCLAEREWDNVGLLIEPAVPISKLHKDILLTNDLTLDVMKEVQSIGSIGMIISYHPPIFKPLKRITAAEFPGSLIGLCLSKGIAVYSPHTALDNCYNGINDWIAKNLGLSQVCPIKSYDGAEIAEPLRQRVGVGRIGYYEEPVNINVVVEKIKRLFGTNTLLCANPHDTMEVSVKKVAICAGSGGSVLSNVQADLYVTGEMSHHSALGAIRDNVIVISATHSRSERGYLPTLKEELLKIINEPDMIPETKIFISSRDRDPFDFI